MAKNLQQSLSLLTGHLTQRRRIQNEDKAALTAADKWQEKVKSKALFSFK